MHRRAHCILAAVLFSLVACVHAEPKTARHGAVTVGDTLSALSEDGQPQTLRIEAVSLDPTDAEGEVFLYDVSFLDDTDHRWKPFCQPDLEGHTTALPLQGSWDARGNYVPSDTVITFACTKGVLAKCVRWGYKPWKVVNGRSLRDHHQACTRMARADYCGDGISHTRDGTLIDLHDGLGIQKPDPGPDLRFEAGWAPEGATYIRRARYAEPLEQLVSECPDRLKGRTALDFPGLEPTDVLTRWPQTLLLNESAPKTVAP